MTRALVGVALMAAAGAASAEPVRGRVVDGVTDEPVAGAYVATDREDGGKALADEDGRFALDVAVADQMIVVIATGYEPASVPLASLPGGDELVIRLRPDDAWAEEVVVVEERAPDAAETPVYELGADEVRALPGAGNDALKSLQSLPGVARVPFGGGGLALRGSSPRDTNVYLDGIEVPILYHFGGLASFYPSAMLASIELAPGAFGAAYGRAQGGLVTLTSRPGRGDRWRAAGEVSLIDASARADGPAAGGTWSLGVRRSYVDAVLAAAFPDDSDLQLTVAPRYWDAQLRYDVALSARDTLTVLAFGADDAMELASADRDDDEPGGFSFASRFARVAVRWQRRAGSALIEVTPWLGVDRSAIRVGDQGLTRTTYPAGVRAQTTVARGAGSLTVGLDAQGARNDLYLNNEPPPMPGVDDGVEVEREVSSYAADLGLWIEGSYRVADGRLNVKPGVRVERYGLSDEWVVDPRLTVSHELPWRLTLKESIGVYHQPPIPADADWGNPDLRSSYSVQGAVGLEAALADGVDASVTAFSQDSYYLAVDVVSAASPAAAGGNTQSGGAGAAGAELLYEQFGTWTYRDNVGRGRAHGVELLAKASTDRVFGWLSYTYSRSLRRGDPARLLGYHPYVLDQPHVLTALASVKLGDHWRAGARVRYATGNPYTPVAGTYFDSDTQRFQPIDGPVLSARLPAYFQLDVRLDRTWIRPWGTLAVFVDVQNATNRANAEGVTYDFDYTTRSYTRGLPVFPSIGVEYRP